jgi:hypothetical protein
MSQKRKNIYIPKEKTTTTSLKQHKKPEMLKIVQTAKLKMSKAPINSLSNIQHQK